MKTGVWILALTVSCCFIFQRSNSFGMQESSKQESNEKKKTEDKEKEKPRDVDVTTKYRNFNSNKFTAPPSKFRKGHVTPRKLAKDALKKSKSGFHVQFPSKAPIPTPTFYKGNLFVSGGFHSKEFYCIDMNGQLVWGINLDDDGPSSSVCEDDVCVFNTESCTIFAVDTKTGKLLWSHWLGDPLMSTPTIANGKVFTSYPANGGGFGGGQQNANPALQNQIEQPKADDNNESNNKSKDNKSKDNKQQKATTESETTKKDKTKNDNSKVKRPPCTHVFVCLDLKTGKIIWQRWIDSDVMSAPVADGDEVYASTFSGTVYRFKQKNGKILSAIQSRATSAPVIVGKDVWFTRRADGANAKVAEESILRLTRDGNKKVFDNNKTKALHLDRDTQSKTELAQKGQQLDASNGFAGGAPMAANPGAAFGNIGQGGVYTCQAFQGSRILNYGKWNFNCQGDEVFCTDAKTGNKKWSTKLKGDLKKVGGSLAAPPVLAGGNLFLATVKGEILQIDPDSGKTTKTYQVGSAMRTQPIIQNGWIIVGTADGKVVAIDTGNKKLTGWTTWGGNSAHTGTVASGKTKP